jgi:hypothetical protein
MEEPPIIKHEFPQEQLLPEIIYRTPKQLPECQKEKQNDSSTENVRLAKIGVSRVTKKYLESDIA